MAGGAGVLPLVRGYLRSAVPRRPNKRLSRGHLAGTSANRQTGGLVERSAQPGRSALKRFACRVRSARRARGCQSRRSTATKTVRGHHQQLRERIPARRSARCSVFSGVRCRRAHPVRTGRRVVPSGPTVAAARRADALAPAFREMPGTATRRNRRPAHCQHAVVPGRRGRRDPGRWCARSC